MKGNLKFIVIGLQILFTATPSAAASLGSIMSGATSDLSSAGQLGLIIAAIAGLVLTVKGFIGMAKGSRGGEGLGINLMSVIIGVILISIPAMILATSGTFTNNGASTGLSKLGIGG